MSTRSLRARLDRLTSAINKNGGQEKDRPFDFAVDPDLAKAMRVDARRLDELRKPRRFRWPQIKEDETEEERALCARIAERARTITCPDGYGFNEVLDDEVRLRSLSGEKLLPSLAYLAQDHVKDRDSWEAQLIARINAFKQSPEGTARARIKELEYKLSSISAAEYSELEGLLALYPGRPRHPMHPLDAAMEAWVASLHKITQERLAKSSPPRR